MDAQTSRALLDSIDVYNFNQIAHNLGWAVLVDVNCRFDHPKLHDLIAIWHDRAAGGLPRRQDMTVRVLQPYIPYLSIFERVQDKEKNCHIRVRLMGTNMAQFTAEMTGHFLEEKIEPQFLPRWQAMGQMILRHGRPVRLLYRADTFHKAHVVGEAFAAPLLSTDGRPDLIMSVTTFDGSDPWDIVAYRVRQQLAQDRPGD